MKKGIMLIVLLCMANVVLAEGIVIKADSGGMEQLSSDLEGRPWYVYFQLGNFLVRNEKLADAVLAFTKSVSINPAFEKSYHNLGVAYYEHGDLEKAVEAFEKSIALNPGYEKARYSLGLAYYEQGNLDDAIDELILLENNPGASFDAAVILVERGRASESMGDLEKALALFRRADTLQQGFPHAKSNAHIIENVLSGNSFP